MLAEPDAVYIMDLDGTMLSTNSFPHWVMYLARAPFPHIGRRRRLFISLSALGMLAQRKLRLTGHERFKWGLQRLWQSATDGDMGAGAQAFTDRMTAYIRPELSPVLRAVAGGRIDALLATAAPADYARTLGRAVGFAHVLATADTRLRGEPSNVGTQKCQAVLQFLASRGWQNRRRILFTDHEDDLPLISVCDHVHWFGSPEACAAVGRARPGIPIQLGFVRDAGPSVFSGDEILA